MNYNYITYNIVNELFFDCSYILEDALGCRYYVYVSIQVLPLIGTYIYIIE